MKGLVYGGPGVRSWTDVPDARIQDPRDAVIRVDAVTITGLVDTYSTPKLLDMLVAGHLDLGDMVTHRFGLAEFAEAYDVFADPARTGALKVVLSR